jgi:hypothetical protein
MHHVLYITASLLLSALQNFNSFCGLDIDILSFYFGGLRWMGHVMLLAKCVSLFPVHLACLLF